MAWDEITFADRLTEAEFERVSRLARQRFGLDLKRGKEQLVAARLSKKLRELGLSSYREYLRHVEEDGTGEALIGLIDALTTNHTDFLRESAHFDFLRATALRDVRDRPRLEFWSAACSTGEEPYSLAFVLIDELGTTACERCRILASDISTRALAAASRGVYAAERLAGLPKEWHRRHFLKGSGKWSGHFRVKPEVMGMIEFRRLNLIERLPSVGPFTVIFCRNVMIYFDRPTQQQVVNRLTERLEPGGYLFVGHSESLTGVEHPLSYVRPAVYRNAARGVRAPSPRGRG